VSVVYTALVGLVAGMHFAYLGILVFGSLAALRWRRLLGVHVVAVGWAVGAIVVRYDCPLTALELQLRERAGRALYQDGFIRHYIRGVLFPEWMTPLVVLVIAGLVVAGWVRLAWRASGRTPASGFR
jgi:hypothetical protein